jgi:PAS domain S-box-containing protein
MSLPEEASPPDVVQKSTHLTEVTAALRESESRFRLLVDHAPEAIVLLDVATGCFLHANPAAEALFKRSADELTRFGPAQLSPPVQPDGQPSEAKARSLIESALAGAKPVFEWTHRDATGRDIPCEVRLLRLDWKGRTVIRGSVLDISARKEAEAHIHRLRRMYAMLSSINQTIVREKDLPALLSSACRTALDKGGFGLTWIGLAEDRRLRVVAHAGADPETLEVLRAFVESVPPDCAFTYHALQKGESAVCPDIASDPRTRAWRDAALARGYRAMASLPLRAGGRIVGTFNLYAGTSDFFDEEEMRLLDELAVDIGFALEVHERERQRRRAERMLQDLLQTVGGVVWEADTAARRFRFVSPHAERLTGHPIERWLAEPDFGASFVHPEDRARVLDALAAARPGQDLTLEYRVTAADGRVLWMRNMVTAVDAGTLRGLMVDLTATHEMEATLRTSEERFREIAETIQDVFWVADAQRTRLFYLSPAYGRIWGRPAGDPAANAREWMNSIHPDDRPRVQEAAARLHTGGYEVEYRIVHSDGNVRWVRDTAFPVRDAAGRVVRLVGVARDVTDRRLLEEQLLQAQKMEAIGRLAGGVAHDFNNLLAAILIQSDLLLENTALDASVRDGLRLIRASAERGTALTRQLLAFSRRQTMQIRDVDLNQLVANLANMLRRLLGEDVQLELRLNPSPLWTRADPALLDQVVINMTINARDAMPTGGQLLLETWSRTVDEAFARARPDAAPGAYVGLRVADTGCGIPPEHLPRIFEPFFTTKEPGKGTGLGLSTAFGIVKQHGGWIEVQSQVGRGTTFEVWLPSAGGSGAGTSPSFQDPRPARGSETILLVEDDEAVRLLARAVLERRGYRVIDVPDGRTALETWERVRGEVDLLITDMVMPGGIGGVELARRLTADRPGVKVLFLTGYSAELTGPQAPLDPGKNVLEKPFRTDAFLDMVRRCLSG